MKKIDELKEIMMGIDKCDVQDFKQQIGFLKKLSRIMKNPKDRDEITSSVKWDKQLQKIYPLSLYYKGEENWKDKNGQLGKFGVWYIKLAEGKKKEFMDAANEWLAMLEDKDREMITNQEKRRELSSDKMTPIE